MKSPTNSFENALRGILGTPKKEVRSQIEKQRKAKKAAKKRK